MNPKAQRLFDIFHPDIFNQHPEEFLAYKRGSQWLHYSPKVLKELSFSLAASLLDFGNDVALGAPIEEKEKVGLICFSRPNWLVVDLATQMAGAVLVPLYPNIMVSEIVNIFNETELKICFVGDMGIYRKIMSVKDQLPHLQQVFVFDEPESDEMDWKRIVPLFSVAMERRVWDHAKEVSGNDIATIIYTSGTTGAPKGVMLTHKNILSNVRDCSQEVFAPLCLTKNESLSFLPLNHILEKMVMYFYLFNSFKVSFAESIETIAADLQEVKPYIFVTVPRLLEKVYEKIIAKGRALTGIKKRLFFWALELAKTFELDAQQSFSYRIQLKIADKLIFSKWREALGGHVEYILVGGAACQPRLIKIFAAAGINILEGYGLTETSPVLAVNRKDLAFRKAGTVGKILDHVEIKLSPDGEICAKGDNIMQGYYKRPQETAEVLQDGWFKTGDIGVLNGRTLTITDRKKEIFKTSGGKFVVPQLIENKMKEDFLIEQIMVVGEGQKFVGALIVPNFAALSAWCERNGLPFESQEKVIQEPKVLAEFQNIMNRANGSFNHVEQIKKFVLLSKEWTVDGTELTPSLKMKRKSIAQKYTSELNSLYEE